MGYTFKNKERIEELRKKVSELLEDNSGAEVFEALMHECPNHEMDGLVGELESELRYRSEYKMIKIKSMDDEIKLDAFLDELYPMYNDRQYAIL
jgi:hypothetical protein